MRATTRTAIIMLGSVDPFAMEMPEERFPRWLSQITTPGRRRMRVGEWYPKSDVPCLGKRLSDVVRPPTITNWHRFVFLHKTLLSK